MYWLVESLLRLTGLQTIDDRKEESSERQRSEGDDGEDQFRFVSDGPGS